MTGAVRVALIATDAFADHIVRASRVARAWPDLTAFTRDNRVHGFSNLRIDTPRIAAVLEFGPILVADGLVPEDSWTNLARLQDLQWTPTATEVVAREDKESFWTADSSKSRPCRGNSDDDPSANIAGVDVELDPMRRLPNYYREDNLRHHGMPLGKHARPGNLTQSERGARGASFKYARETLPVTHQEMPA